MVIKQVQVIKVGGPGQGARFLDGRQERSPGQDRLQRLVGISCLLLRFDQRVAHIGIQAHLFIDGFAALFKLGEVLFLPLFEEQAHNMVVHLQRGIGEGGRHIEQISHQHCIAA